MTDPVFLVFGSKGWIGSLVIEELKKQVCLACASRGHRGPEAPSA